MVTFDLAGEGSLMHRFHIVEVSILARLLLGFLDDVVSVPLEVKKILFLECEKIINNDVMYKLMANLFRSWPHDASINPLLLMRLFVWKWS